MSKIHRLSIMFCLGIILVIFGLAASNTTPSPSDRFFQGETEWDCTNDHAPHQTDPRKFLQSANGFGTGASVVEASCATKLQVFSQVNGKCLCLYAPELRALLAQPCSARLVRDRPEQYDLLVPSLNRETIEELYVRRSCYDLLPGNIVKHFLDQNVNPLFFNLTGCRCDWTPEADNVRSRPVGEGEKCERLLDQNFTSTQVSSDEVGNWISVSPSAKQNNMTVVDGGSVFGDDLYATLSWKLMGADFKDLTIFARFQSRQNNGLQTVYTNICSDEDGSGGMINLSFDPSREEYSLRFFTQQPVSCKPENPSGGLSEQRVQVIYRNGVVKMMVNEFDCDVSALKPATISPDKRIRFSTECPLQVGGAVMTPSLDAPNTAVKGLQGVYKRLMVLRNCAAPPRMVLDRIQGVV